MAQFGAEYSACGTLSEFQFQKVQLVANEEQKEPEQMSRDNARQILQAIEQDEKETQKRLNEMKAEERKEQTQENKRQNKDW